MKWNVGQKSEYGTHNPSIIYDEEGHGIAQVYGISLNTMLEDLQENDMQGLSNACLISAAPELLEALESVMWIVESAKFIDTGGIKAKARAAIKKATNYTV